MKVYLVRCDNKEKYKETVRKEIKDWVKSLDVSTSGKSTIKGQERHDAYEYLILHVVLPGTLAATQSRSSKHLSLEATESTDSVNSIPKSKWTGKSSSTIYDKLRADFHSSSKAPFERVAQVRLVDPAKPSTALSPSEIEEQWVDLVEKLKTAILRSFDARVAQYEEHIREREAQRNLPGWNFCTFFILKEGLARGFENVGLLEDALQIYEELDVGLDLVIQDQAREDHVDAANTLLPYALDLKDIIRKVLNNTSMHETQNNGEIGLSLKSWAAVEAESFAWKLERRNYQQMILTNQVSALDFRIYIFIRQTQIMLRRANVPTPTSKTKSLQQQGGARLDANILSEICVRSTRFSNLAARNLRQDLFAAWGGQQGLPDDEREMQRVAIDSIVASWKWSSLLQTLSECQIVSSMSRLATQSNSSTQDGELFSPTDIAESRKQRDRGYSVSTSASSETGISVNGISPQAGKDAFSALRIVHGSKDAFVFQVAELFLMLRTIFQQVCHEFGLLDFLRNESDGTAVAIGISHGSVGILAPSLQSMLQSDTAAIGTYKLLTVCACHCYTIAGKSRASRQLLYDLARVEVHNSDYDAAMAWLDAIPGSMESAPQTPMDYSILKLYIICLRKSGRHEDLASKLFLSLQSPHGARKASTLQQTWTELVEAASNCDKIDLSFESMFAVNSLSNFITYGSETDEFTVSLTLQVVLPIKDIGHTAVSLNLDSRSQSTLERICLRYEGQPSIENGLLLVHLQSVVATEGWYEATSLSIVIGNIRFTHEISAAKVTNSEDQKVEIRPPQATQLYIYPSWKSPHLQASDALVRDLGQRRSLLIHIHWPVPDRSVHSAQLRLKPATAGFRLDVISSASPQGHKFDVKRVEDTPFIDFASVNDTITTLEIPYVLDNPGTPSISTRAELRYATDEGTFEIYDTLSTTCILPISVNVQDYFQADATFSQFTFSPSRPIPIEIVGCALAGNDEYQVVSDVTKPVSVQAFVKQPVSWVVKLVGQDQSVDAYIPKSKDKSQLGLTIDYRSTDEAILQTIRDEFSQSLETTPYRYVTRPLLSHLGSKLQSLWTESEIELIALTSEIDMWSFEELDWATLLHAFDRQTRSGIVDWLREWHEEHKCIQLRLEAASQRTLKLLVDAPRAQTIVTARIDLPTMQSRKCVVGQPSLARLYVSVKHLQKNVTNEEISVEVTGQNDLWLVGGQRKAIIPPGSSLFESTVILVPQKAGSLLLPLIDVKCRDSTNGQQIPVEVEQLSSATAVDVSESVGSTTIGIGDGETAEGHWVVETRTMAS